MPKFFLDRRNFALGAAAAATTALVCPGDLLAQSDTGSLDEKAKAALARLATPAQAEVEMKVASIFRKYGSKLNAEQQADIRRIMAETQEGLEKMRAFVLENGDQPADSFRAYRQENKEEKTHAASAHAGTSHGQRK
ncbi:MAG TPA: hypothetical protein VFB79_13580 [Candidatus Angelobacter sp.]|nr:hypothetical protein [Candidatus Angelobacter sp.]